ncbi:MAG: hypothetical protein AB8B99_22625 [Phormidesmis sp.]
MAIGSVLTSCVDTSTAPTKQSRPETTPTSGTELVAFPNQTDTAQQSDQSKNQESVNPQNINPQNINPQNINPQNINPQNANRPATLSARPTRLSMARLDLIASELGSSESLLREQSFAVNLPSLGVIDFVPSQFTADNGRRKLALRWRDINGNYIPLFLSEQWDFNQLSTVAFEDIDGDRLGPDVVAIAQYTSGIGPEGAKPFSRAIVLFNDGNNQFGIDAATENWLKNTEVATLEALRTSLTATFQSEANGAGQYGTNQNTANQNPANQNTANQNATNQNTATERTAAALSLQDLTAGSYARIKANGQFCAGFVCTPAQRRYPLADALLSSRSNGERIEIALKPNTPVSEADAIAYGKILSEKANVLFENPITEKQGTTTLGKTYLPPRPPAGSIPHTGYTVRFEMAHNGSVAEITVSIVTL